MLRWTDDGEVEGLGREVEAQLESNPNCLLLSLKVTNKMRSYVLLIILNRFTFVDVGFPYIL